MIFGFLPPPANFCCPLCPEQRKGTLASNTSPFPQLRSLDRAFRQRLWPLFILFIYWFSRREGWWRSALAKLQPPAPAALESWVRPGRWRRRSTTRGCRAQGRAGCWHWPCARWRSAFSPTFGRPSCRPAWCAWKRSAGSSKWRRLFWDESTNCWTRNGNSIRGGAGRPQRCLQDVTAHQDLLAPLEDLGSLETKVPLGCLDVWE